MLIQATTWTNLDNTMLSKKKPVTKDHKLYDSIYLKDTEQQIYRNRLDSRLPGDGGIWRLGNPGKGMGSFGMIKMF